MFSVILALALSGELFAGQARAGQAYTVTGKDSFTIGGGDIESEVDYRGTETLNVIRHGKVTRYVAHVEYMRTEAGASTAQRGSFVLDVLPSGEELDSANHDPDYLAVLNQPFAVQLDGATLAALRGLSGTLPFSFPSPFSTTPLRGYLVRISGDRHGAERLIGLRFSAAGPMRGALPDRPGLTLYGAIEMHGSAFYGEDANMLLSLDATVTISGNVGNRSGKEPVKIVYRRTIRPSAGTRGFAGRPRNAETLPP